jgi:hypothetical protein
MEKHASRPHPGRGVSGGDRLPASEAQPTPQIQFLHRALHPSQTVVSNTRVRVVGVAARLRRTQGVRDSQTIVGTFARRGSIGYCIPAASYCSLAYSALASFRMGMSASAFSQIHA